MPNKSDEKYESSYQRMLGEIVGIVNKRQDITASSARQYQIHSLQLELDFELASIRSNNKKLHNAADLDRLIKLIVKCYNNIAMSLGIRSFAFKSETANEISGLLKTLSPDYIDIKHKDKKMIITNTPEFQAAIDACQQKIPPPNP